MRPLTNLKEAEAALAPFFPSNLKGKRTAYTIEHMWQFMDYLGNPQNTPEVIHVAGTSGKTSTAYYAAALLRQAGKRVGLLVSPHIESLNERVQINLEPLPEAPFCHELTQFLELVERSGVLLSYAEVLYAFAYWEFARSRVDYIVVEVGLGGLLDATNVIDRSGKICIITDIGLDHTEVLGSTLQEITRHKAGIIQLHNTVFCHQQGAAIMETIRTVCQQKQADLHISTHTETIPDLPLFQQRNFTLALQAVQFALLRESSAEMLDEVQQQAAAHVHIPARMETFRIGDKTIILDGAHNPQKFGALRAALQDQFPGQPIAVLAALVAGRGRDVHELVAAVVPFASHLIATSLPPSKAAHTGRKPEDIIEACTQEGLESVEAIADRTVAFETLLARPEAVLVVTGSFYLLETIRPKVIALAG
jgi:dihydrofolate synthase/folylpolyglutamate synthase